MTVSISGVFTLLVLIFCGPVWYACRHVWKKRKERSSTTNNNSNNLKDGHDEMLDEDAGINNIVTFTEPAHTIHYQEDDETKRDVMHSSEYLFALIGYAIGIGNVWRFPYVIAQNGGAAALIAYIVCAVVVVVPLFLYEMIAGQHTRLSTIRCYNMIRPRWTSLGVASGVMLCLVLSYYGMLVAYTFPYMWNSLQTPLPWLEDGAELFWKNNILNGYESSELMEQGGPGPLQTKLVLSLIATWAIVFFCTGFGKPFLAKVTYVTVLLPVFLMILLVFRTVFLTGAKQGLHFYLGTFQGHQLLDVNVWAAACSQIMFSLSPGFGTAITFSSFAKPKEDVYRACMIVAISNSAFSIIGGLATFSLVGHMAYKEGVEVAEMATRSGAGLAFITMAEGMQLFGPLANVFAVLFFFMLFLLGLDSVYAILETMVSYVLDFSQARGWKLEERPKWQPTLLCITIVFLLGLTFTTRLGNESLEVIDHFVGSIFLLLVACVESIMFIVDFGYPRMEYALQKATFGNPSTPQGRSLFPSFLCKANFFLFVPLISGLLGLYMMIVDTQSTYRAYPPRLVGVWGWGILTVLILIIPATLWKRDPSQLPPFSMEDIGKDDSDIKAARTTATTMEAPSISLTPTNFGGGGGGGTTASSPTTNSTADFGGHTLA